MQSENDWRWNYDENKLDLIIIVEVPEDEHAWSCVVVVALWEYFWAISIPIMIPLPMLFSIVFPPLPFVTKPGLALNSGVGPALNSALDHIFDSDLIVNYDPNYGFDPDYFL
ncbi:hypothetical protein EVAR_40686_1 [Eumeta japonica]|uniref:Uncharacterized protein n=1 Tax=Eumeta variegata TaxID=151549 RepID=A0A4C1X6A2_EUMVA|nr:hypothetical protein EVAR_40686_1 [Eumeta japonica]